MTPFGWTYIAHDMSDPQTSTSCEKAVAKLRYFEEVTGEAIALISDLLPLPVDDATEAAELRQALLNCDNPVIYELIKAANRKGDGAMVLSIALISVARLHTFARSLASELDTRITHG